MLAKTSPSSNNIFLFTGEDDFSLQRKIQTWRTEFAKKYSAQSIVFLDAENLSEPELLDQLKQALSPSLFTAKKLIIVRNVPPSDQILEIIDNVPKDYFLVFWQPKLDRRLSFYKQLVKKVDLKDFSLPHGRLLNSWIKTVAQELGAKIDEDAIELLAVYLGRDMFEKDKEVFNLWQAYNELLKLTGFNSHITKQAVEQLTKPKLAENVFILSDHILKKNKQAALKTFEELMSQSTTDEKTSIIKIVGLLSEQLRSQIMINYLKRQKLSQQDMADKLGWSTGRVFIHLKHAHQGSLETLKALLGSLLKIDISIKTTTDNPRLLMDLFINRACS